MEMNVGQLYLSSGYSSSANGISSHVMHVVVVDDDAQERSVSIVCANPCAVVPALAGSLDFQGCVHALHESAHGPSHVF